MFINNKRKLANELVDLIQIIVQIPKVLRGSEEKMQLEGNILGNLNSMRCVVGPDQQKRSGGHKNCYLCLLRSISSGS